MEVRLHIAGYADSDPEERAELAWRLQEDLRALEVEDVSRPPRRPAVGAKGSALEWAQLVVTLAGSPPPPGDLMEAEDRCVSPALAKLRA